MFCGWYQAYFGGYHSDESLKVDIDKNKRGCENILFYFSVRAKGLEPPRLTAPDPKSGAATNYATRALLLVSECKGREKNGITKLLSLFYPKR